MDPLESSLHALHLVRYTPLELELGGGTLRHRLQHTKRMGFCIPCVKVQSSKCWCERVRESTMSFGHHSSASEATSTPTAPFILLVKTCSVWKS